MSYLKKIISEFYYKDPHHETKYPMSVGWMTATGLTGFIAGMILASIMWFVAYYIRHML